MSNLPNALTRWATPFASLQNHDFYILKFKFAVSMRTFVISDIHGNNELFRNSLKQVGFNQEDRLILLGDLIDRGVDSKGVLDTVMLLMDTGFNLDCLIGNHEKMFLDASLSTTNLNHWLRNGGDKTLASFLTISIEK